MTRPGRRLTIEDRRTSLTSAQWSIYEAGWDPTARFRVAVCGRRFGKALATDTALPSPDGWTTMGNVSKGSRLYDEYGNICEVTYCTKVMFNRPCNLITFADGAKIIADDYHNWTVYSDRHKSTLLTTSEIRERCAVGQVLRVQAVYPVGIRDRNGLQIVRDRLRMLRQVTQTKFKLLRPGVGLFVCGTQDKIAILDDLRKLGLRICFKRAHFSFTVETIAGLIISSIMTAKSQPVRCIQVNSISKTFLCSRHYIPTHNTFLMAEELRRAVKLAVKNKVSTDNEIWYGAPTFIQAKRVMWARLKQIIPRHWVVGKPNETNCSIRIHSGHVIRLVGLETSDNLRGSGLWFFGGDEWADCKPSVWTDVIRPMLSTAQGHALFIGTPKGFNHFRDAYVLGQSGGDPAYRSFLYTTEEGGNVPRDELVAARRDMDLRTYQQEYCASFETYIGRVIYAFSRARNVEVRIYDSRRTLHIGMDFNINPMSATIWQEDGPRTYQIDEIIMPTSNTDEMADEIIRRYGIDGFDPGTRLTNHVWVYPDPAGSQRRSSAAGRTDIGILREKGFVVIAPRAHPPVRDRINTMNRHFSNASGTVLATVDPRCVKSMEAYERLTYRDGTSEPDKTHGYDHLVDATGYYLHTRSQNKADVVAVGLMER